MKWFFKGKEVPAEQNKQANKAKQTLFPPSKFKGVHLAVECFSEEDWQNTHQPKHVENLEKY